MGHLMVFVLCILLGGLGSGNAAAAELIRLNGTGGGLTLLAPIARAYSQKNPGVQFDIKKSIGSTAALKALRAGQLDLALSGRALRPHEEQSGLVGFEYGKTPLAIIAHRDVMVKDVTRQELARLYAGKTGLWPHGVMARPVLRLQEDADAQALVDLSPEMKQAQDVARLKMDMIVAVTDQDCFQMTKRTKGAFSAIALPMVLNDPGGCAVLSLDGVMPTLDNIRSGSYPLVKNIYLVTGPATPPAARKFVSFLVSKAGQKLAAEHGLLVTVK